MVSLKIQLGIVFCVLLSVAAMPFAHARGIVCRGPNQVVKGQGLIPTPACQDRYLAQIARERGYKVSDKEILTNYLKKREICQELGSDIRIQDLCAGVTPMGGPGGGGLP